MDQKERSGPIPPQLTKSSEEGLATSATTGSNIKKNINYRNSETIINSGSCSPVSLEKISPASEEETIDTQPVREEQVSAAGQSAAVAAAAVSDPNVVVEMKSSRSVEIPSQILPQVDCTEHIVICIDLSAEMSERRYRARAGNSFSAMEIVKRALKLFISNKQMVCQPANKHKFALVILLENPLWVFDFTSDINDLFTQIESLNALDPGKETFDMSLLFDILYEKAKPPLIEINETSIPPYITRVVLIYGRSRCMPVFTQHISQNLLSGSACFYLDIIYLHESPTQDNQSEMIYQELCELDVKGFSYIFEISKTPTRVFDAFGKLLAHPLQRAVQSLHGYNLEPAPNFGMEGI